MRFVDRADHQPATAVKVGSSSGNNRADATETYEKFAFSPSAAMEE